MKSDALIHVAGFGWERDPFMKSEIQPRVSWLMATSGSPWNKTGNSGMPYISPMHWETVRFETMFTNSHQLRRWSSRCEEAS
jgi:hypothetical protein